MPARALISDGTRWIPYIGGGAAIDQNPPPSADVVMVTPTEGADVSGDVYLVVDIAVSVGATAVTFQVGHPDNGYYPAALYDGSTTRWRSTSPWKTALSLKDKTTALPNDFAAYVRPQITTAGGTVWGDYVECFTLNHPTIVGTIPAWRSALSFTSTVSGTITDFYNSFDTDHGTNNNPDGNPPATLITEAGVVAGKMVRVVMPDDHTTADQPNSGLRWQVQTQPELVDGDAIWVGFPFRIPTDFPTPTSSHISMFQCMGADGAGSYALGLTLMLHAQTKTSTTGYSDMATNQWQINMNDGRYAEPALTLPLPFWRGGIGDIVLGMGFSLDPRKGWLEIKYRAPGGGPLVRHEFFGIPGKYRLPCCLITPGGVGQRIDQHIYRSRGKFASVSMDFGQLKIRETSAEADPGSGV